VVNLGTEVPVTQSKSVLWHLRLGHQGHTVVKDYASNHKLNLSENDINLIKQIVCQTCAKGKLSRKPIGVMGDPQYKATAPLQTLHGDLVGPVTIKTGKGTPRCATLGGNLYALVVVDEYTHVVWVRLLNYKSDATAELIKLFKLIQTKTGRTIVRFHIDGGGEFRDFELRAFLADQGTEITTTTASTPAHNGIAERMNRTLFEMTRALLIHAQAPAVMWGEALLWATHLYNITSHPASGDRAPYVALFNYLFNHTRLRVWGCDVLVQKLPQQQSKIQSRGNPGIFVGFDLETRSYRIMNPITKKIILSDDVVFYENDFTCIRQVTATVQPQLNHSHINPFSALGEDLEENEIGLAPDCTDYTVLTGSSPADAEVVSDSPSPNNGATADLEVSPAEEDPEETGNQANSEEMGNPAHPSVADQDPEAELTDPEVEFADPEAEVPDPEAEHDRPSVADPKEAATIRVGPELATTRTTDPKRAISAQMAPTKERIVKPTAPTTNVGPSNAGTRITQPPISREVRDLQGMLNTWNPKHTQPSQAIAAAPRTRKGRMVQSSQPITSNPLNYDAKDMHEALTDGNIEKINAAVVQASPVFEPKTYKQAEASEDKEEWRKAMQEEINSMERLGVWKIVPRPKGANILRGRWVYKNKLGDNNQLLRRKARFVAKGFEQIYGRDFNETHSPVAKMKSIKMILSLVAQLDLELFQIDFDTAFLNADVEEDIYMEQPDGFHTGGQDKDLVCKLIKSIYGLKQASRNWNKEIDSFMKSIGYVPLISDPCVYIKRTQAGRFILLSLYVDDTIAACAADDRPVWESDKAAIAKRYAIKDLGDCDWILNMKVSRDRSKRRITLSQEAYIRRIITEFGYDNSKPISTPTQTNDFYLPLDNTDPVPLDSSEKERYQSMIGALLYAANITRIDIAYIIGQLCRYTSKPCAHHMAAAIRVFKYLNYKPDVSLIFGLNPPTDPKQITVTGYTDANWANDIEKGKSISGGLIRFNGDVINWYSKQQKSVALSTMESEYMAMSSIVCEALWYRFWVSEVFNQTITCSIKCDNESAIKLAHSDVIHQRSKHINIRYHHVRDNVKKGRVNIEWVGTDEQQADMLTKALGPGTFKVQCDKLMCY
jgi:transposase InsO family protein